MSNEKMQEASTAAVEKGGNVAVEVREMTLAEQLAEIDAFPVEWAKRDKHGNFELASNVFRVKDAPPPMFGQNIQHHGFEKALELAEASDYDGDWDFGHVFIVDKTLRRETDGNWYVNLRVDQHKCRFVNVTSILVDENENPVLDEHGKPQLRTAPRRESWITVELSMIEPVKHPLRSVYRQSDRNTAAIIRMNERSSAMGERKQRGERKGKGRRKRLSPDEIATVMQKLGADSAS